MVVRFTPGLYVGALLASGLLALLMSALPTDASAEISQAQKHTQVFDILRNGDPVGTHQVLKEYGDDTVKVRVSSNIELRFLGFTVYRFDYTSEEVWDDQGLRRLHVEVNNDGEKSGLQGLRNGQAFEWNDGERVASHVLPLYPTNHWTAAILGQERVLNTLTGEVDSVNIKALGREILRLPGSTVAATRYRYEGDLALDSWYDDQGRWVGMRFRGEDGSTIEYLCRDCRESVVM